MKKKWIIIGIIVVVALGFGFRFVRNRRARQAMRQGLQNVATAKARIGAIDVTITGTGNIVSVDKRTIKTSVAGTVDKVLVEDGQAVKKDQVIAILTNDDLLSQYEQSKVDLDSAELTLDTYRNPTANDKASMASKLAQAQLTVENRRNDVASLTVSSPIDGRVVAVKANVGDTAASNQVVVTVADDTSMLALVNVLQADISKVAVGQSATLSFGTALPSVTGTVDSIAAEGATASGKTTVPVRIKFANTARAYRTGLAVNASIEVSDEETVYVSGSVAAQAKYDLKAQAGGTVDSVLVRDGDEVKQGQVLVKLTSQSVIAALQTAESDLAVAQENFDRLNSGYAPQVTESQVKQQEMRVTQAEMTLNKRAADVEALQIKSPIDGIIVSHAIAAGDTVNANANCFVAADYSKMQMVIPVDELDIMQVKIGQKATVSVEALAGRKYAADVTRIATEGVIKDGIANYDVTLTLTDTKDIRGSMTGNAEIVLARKEGILVVPAEAVRTAAGQKRITVMKAGAAATVDIKTGITNGVLTEIVSGLSEGDMIVISDERTGVRTINMGGGQIIRGQGQGQQPAGPGGK